MESRNPVFNRGAEFKRGGYATFNTPSAVELEDMYAAPSATSVDTNRMTLDDVVIRTATLFGPLLVTAALTYFVWKPTSFFAVLGAGLVALLLSFFAVSRHGEPRVAVMVAYAGLEGVFAGGLSYFYGMRFGQDLIPQAVLGTLCTFGAMLLLYRTGKVRNSPKFQKTLLIAGAGYFIFAMVHLTGVLLHWWDSVYWGGGLLPIALSAFGVVLASLFLVLDFDFVEQGLRNNLPKQAAWVAAFGLVVTLVWLYLEILRLLAILRGND